MASAPALYCRYIGYSLRSQLQYRASFAMHAAGHFLITAFEFLGIAALFNRFRSLQGWTLPEIALFYGIISTAFALSEAFSRGFDTFDRLIKAGDFDRILLRPRTTALQILGQEFQLMRVGRFSQGMLVLLWAVATLQIAWTVASVLLLVAAILGGACLFGGLIVLQATLCFWTTESIEIVNCATYGGVEAAQFPITIYKPWFRQILIYVLPLAAINYLPAHAILNKADPLGFPRWSYWLAPLAGPLFLGIALQAWRIGVRHYRSTGS